MEEEEEEEQHQTAPAENVTESHTLPGWTTLTEINDCGNDNYTLLYLLGHS